MSEQASAWWTALDSIEKAADRLSRVVILNQNACDVIAKEDGEHTLFYIDPPYSHETRAAKHVYRYEMTLADHTKLLQLIREVKGRVILSGYPDTTYHSMLHDWYRVDVKIPNHAASGVEKRVMTEVLWMNYNPSMHCVDPAPMWRADDGSERSTSVHPPVDFQAGR